MDRDGSRVGLDGRRCLTIDFFFLRTLTLFFKNKIQLPFFLTKYNFLSNLEGECFTCFVNCTEMFDVYFVLYSRRSIRGYPT